MKRRRIKYHPKFRSIFGRRTYKDKFRCDLVYPQDQIDQILKSTPILMILEERIVLKREKSGDYTGHCPFCRGTGKRYFRYSPFYGLWKCFGCGIGGRSNSVNFYARYHKIPFSQALIQINKIYHNSRYKLTGALKSTCTDDGLPF